MKVEIGDATLYLGDCLDVLKTLEDNSVDSIVTDPPYGLAFMGRKWDYDVPDVAIWEQCLRVLKPGGHLLAFAGTRTQHRMAVNIEDAGFDIRDMIAYVYGSGFPKSLDVSKAIDKAAGHRRATEYEPNHKNGTFGKGMGGGKHGAQSEPPVTAAAAAWQGWGTALKPALEPITVARKPLAGTVAENVLEHGTGALNIDGCRVETKDSLARPFGSGGISAAQLNAIPRGTITGEALTGRWPANLIHDGSDEVLSAFPMSGPPCGSAKKKDSNGGGVTWKIKFKAGNNAAYVGDTGSTARFFYCAKASRSDRGEGNTHPTVKPTDLMRYLCRLVTPPGGVVLDPFMGSGSTGKAAVREGFKFIGIEREFEYFAMACRRIEQAAAQGTLFDPSEGKPNPPETEDMFKEGS